MTYNLDRRLNTAPLARNLINNMLKAGYSLAQVSRDVGIDPQYLESGLTESELDILSTHAWEVIGDPAIGLKIGGQVDPKLLNMPGLYALVAPTVGVAIERLANFAALVWGYSMTIVENGSYFELKVDSRSDEGRPYGFAKVDLQYTYILGFLHLTTERQIRPRYMKLRRPEPGFMQLYRDTYQCPVRFGEEENIMALTRDDFATRQFTQNAVMEPFLAKAAADLLRDLKDDSISGRVRRILETSTDLREISLASIAKLLVVSERTLQRRLSEEKVNFADLLDDVRREWAMRELTLKDTNTNDLAYRLGFASVNSFYRAFKRWTGETVERFRKSQLSSTG